MSLSQHASVPRITVCALYREESKMRGGGDGVEDGCGVEFARWRGGYVYIHMSRLYESL